MTRLRLALAFGLCFLLLGSVTIKRGPGGGTPVNQAQDTDGDGFPDWLHVTCLYDGNAACSTADDVDAALQVLTDAGGSTLRVGAGFYRGPTDGGNQTNGVIEPKIANTRIECDSGAILEGIPAGLCSEDSSTLCDDDTDCTGTCNVQNGAEDNKNAIYTTAAGFQLLGCEIHGGMPESYDGDNLGFGGSTSRVGVFMESDNAIVDGNTIHDTAHACIYYRNASGAVIQGNQMDDCGGRNNTDTTTGFTQPCVYLFAQGGNTTSDIVVSENICEGAGSVGYNTRKDSSSDTISDILFVNNSARDIRNAAATPVYQECVRLGGTENSEVSGLICADARHAVGFVQGSDYLLNGDANSNFSVLVTGVVATNMLGTSASGINISAYQQNVTVTNTIIDTTASGRPCVQYTAPNRGVVYDGLTLTRCGGHGFVQSAQGNLTPDEGIVFRNITIIDVDDDPSGGSTYSGFAASGARAAYNIFENIRVTGWTSRGFDINAAWDYSTFRNIYTSPLRSLFQGAMTEASANAITCNAAADGYTVITTNASGTADCTFASGTGTTANQCYCNGTSWTDANQNGNGHGLRFGGANTTGNVFENITCHDIFGANYNCVDMVSTGTNNQFTNISAMNTIGLATSGGGSNYTFESALDYNGSSVLETPESIVCVNRYTGGTDACNQP